MSDSFKQALWMGLDEKSKEEIELQARTALLDGIQFKFGTHEKEKVKAAETLLEEFFGVLPTSMKGKGSCLNDGGFPTPNLKFILDETTGTRYSLVVYIMYRERKGFRILVEENEDWKCDREIGSFVYSHAHQCFYIESKPKKRGDAVLHLAQQVNYAIRNVGG